jgi:hypothetical protein
MKIVAGIITLIAAGIGYVLTSPDVLRYRFFQ